jgi:hypothetical protein
MSGVFRNIDPPPPHRPATVYPPPPPLVRGEDTLAGWRGGGSTVRKTPDTALYSIFVSTLCRSPNKLWRSNSIFNYVCLVAKASKIGKAYANFYFKFGGIFLHRLSNL